MRDDDSAASELATGQCFESLLGLLRSLILDIDLANAGVGACTARARDLDFDDLAVLGTLVLDVFFDFY